jgi:predicted AlkP superfamily pyrophosphatase or phosphodiesterase
VETFTIRCYRPTLEDPRRLGTVRPVVSDEPLLPDYGGACLSSLVPALRTGGQALAEWLPAPVAGATQVLLLVVDGLGWQQLREHAAGAPTLSGGTGTAITSVVPTTTATALTSITTGRTPAEHGVVGYRMAVPTAAADSDGSSGTPGQVLDVLHWTTPKGDARQRLPATTVQRHTPFLATGIPAVTRAEFSATGFSALHLSGARVTGWRMPSTLVVEARRLLQRGEPFVYAYYDGIDKVAHEHGLAEHYMAELRAVDALVADLLSCLPPGAALVVTSDHGQVEVTAPARLPGRDLLALTALVSGEGRFRWFHARPGAAEDLFKAAEEAYDDEAWVRTRQQIEEDGWFGGRLEPEVAARLGDVAVVARAPVAFLDPADTGESRLLARHGSLTAAEMLVPLLAWRA